jgi:type I restriction enzyme S subunit
VTGKDSLYRLSQHGIDTVPNHWSLSRVKYLADYINGCAFKPDEWGTEGKSIIRIQNLTDPNADMNRYLGELPSQYLVKSGDLLISWSASLGVYKWSGEDAWLNQHIFKVNLYDNAIEKGFFWWLAEWFINELSRDAHGSTMQHLTKDAFGSFPVLLPPVWQQHAIAEYLDRETARIDTLVAAKERVLGLLAEKRRAIITQAVTQGMNPDTPMRDSGVDWLGDVPAHWGVFHLKRILSAIDYGISESVSPTGAVAVLRMGDLQNGEIRFDKLGFVDEVDEYLLLKPGDLVFNRTNSLDQIGKVGMFRAMQDYPVTFASYLVRLRCESQMLPEYLNHLLNSPPVLQWSRGEALPSIGQANLNPNRYAYLRIVLPPLDEQRAIVKHIEAVTQKLDALQDITKRTVGLFKERRAALIAAAVTGRGTHPAASGDPPETGG